MHDYTLAASIEIAFSKTSFSWLHRNKKPELCITVAIFSNDLVSSHFAEKKKHLKY